MPSVRNVFTILSPVEAHGDSKQKLALLAHAPCMTYAPFREAVTMDRLYTTKEAAKLLGVSVRTMERRRQNSDGSYYIREGRLVFYRHSDLTQWQEENRNF